MPIRINTHTHTRQHTHSHMPIYVHAHARPHTHTHTSPYERGKPIRTNPYPPQALRVSTRPINPPPASPSRNNSPDQPQPAQPSPQRTSLLLRVLSPPDQSTAPLFSFSHSSTSLRFSLAPMHNRAHPRSLSHPSLTYASPSLPHAAYFDSVLPRTRARYIAASRRRRAPPDGRNSRTYNWRDATVLGPRASKLAAFPSDFPQSLPGTQPPLPALLVRRLYASVQRGRVYLFSSPSSLSPPDLPAGVCPSVQRGWSVQRGPGPPHVSLSPPPLTP
jgi:hypothetical protein